MGLPRFNRVRQLDAGAMPFENYLKQINLLYPNLPDMYKKYVKRVNEFDTDQLERLVRLGEFQLAYELFDTKLNMFNELKADNYELFDAFLEAYEVRDKISEVFEVGSLTLEEMLEVVHELYPEEYDEYITAIELIKQFEKNEFFRLNQLTLEIIEEDGYEYTVRASNIRNRISDAIQTMKDATEDGMLLSNFSEDQMNFFSEQLSEHFTSFARNPFSGWSVTLETLTPSNFLLAATLSREGMGVGRTASQMFQSIADAHQYENTNYSNLLNQSTLGKLNDLSYNAQEFLSNWMKYKIRMIGADPNLANYSNWNPSDTGISHVIDSLLYTIIDQLENNNGFVFKDDFVYLFKNLAEQAIQNNQYLLENASKLQSHHVNDILRGMGRSLYGIMEAVTDHAYEIGSTGSDAFYTFFNGFGDHFEGWDNTGIVGGIMMTSDEVKHAEFICMNIYRLIRDSAASTYTHMVGNSNLQNFFNQLKSENPTAFAGIQDMMNNAINYYE